MDKISPERRRINMQRIQSKDTLPELIVRKMIFAKGYRYRIHDKTLPGKPDIVFRKSKKAIFVNGCFWHHHDCKEFHVPKTNENFWLSKIGSNVKRDEDNVAKLNALGWDVLVIWECELSSKSLFIIEQKITNFLELNAC